MKIPKGFVVAGILFILNLPFLNKPFHIDDVYFLEVAENILKHPLDPFAGQVALMDQDLQIFKHSGKPPNTFEGMSHPPLVPYALAGVIKVCGPNHEFPFHLIFFIFPLLASFACYSIARRVTTFPLLATLFVLASPIFIVNSQNLMTDVPMLSLILTSLALFMRGLEAHRAYHLLLAGLFAGLAVLTRYVALLIFPMFFAYEFFVTRNFRRTIVAFLGSLIPIGLWCLQNWIYHGQLHIIASSAHYAKFYEHGSFGLSDLLLKAISDVAGIGLIGICLLPLMLFHEQRKFLLFPLLFIGLSGASFLLRLQGYSMLQILLLGTFLSAGIYLMISSQSRGSSIDRFCVFWFWITFATGVLMLPFGTGRYMLPALPPLIFLFFRKMERNLRMNAALFLGIVVMMILNVTIGIADLHLAESYRKVAYSIKQQFAPSRIWYIGEWGFRYYMNEIDARYLLSNDNAPAADDIVVRAELAGLHWMSNELSGRCEEIKVLEDEDQFPVRVLNTSAKAGFYSHGFGLLPVGFGRAPLERFTLWRVRAQESSATAIRKEGTSQRSLRQK